MTDKNIEGMKKLIEDKKLKLKNDTTLRPNKKMGGDAKKGISTKKAGGMFDK